MGDNEPVPRGEARIVVLTLTLTRSQLLIIAVRALVDIRSYAPDHAHV